MRIIAVVWAVGTLVVPSTGFAEYSDFSSPSCCLDPAAFVPDNEHHDAPHFKHGYSNGINPVANQIFTPPVQCNASSAGTDVCQAAAALYSIHGSSLYYKAIFPYHSPHPGHKAETTTQTLAPPMFINHKWTSDRHSDLAVVSKGCCFNVYPEVQPGDVLSSECMNDILGTTNDLSDIPLFSLFTAGNAALNIADLQMMDTAMFSVFIGGSYTSATSAEIAWRSATPIRGDPIPGLPLGLGLFIGGEIVDGLEIIVENGSAVAAANTDRIASYSPVSKAQAESARTAISARVCALSKAINELNDTGSIIFGGTAVSTSAMFECPTDGASSVCVISLTGDEAMMVTQSTSIEVLGTPQVVKINVRGGRALSLSAFQAPPLVQTPEGLQFVWNFPDAQFLKFSPRVGDTMVFNGTVIAPIAEFVRVLVPVVGAVALGNIDSNSYFDAPLGGVPLEQRISCPEHLTAVAFCDCLCPKEKPRNKYDNGFSIDSQKRYIESGADTSQPEANDGLDKSYIQE